MDLLSTILACSLYVDDDPLVRAIAESNSQSNPDFVFDASVDATQIDPLPPPKSVDAAVTRAREILAKGDRPLLGLMQLAPEWLDAFGRPLAEAFDPCENIAIGTAMLSAFDYACGLESTASRSPAKPLRAQASEAHPRRSCALRKYEDAMGLPDFVSLTTLELRYQRLARVDLSATPILSAPSARAWGSDKLFVFSSPGSFAPLTPP
jgi:hypothetical protein